LHCARALRYRHSLPTRRSFRSHDERLRGRPFQVRRYQSVDEIKTCHILFIRRPDGARLEETLARLKNRPILTVSDVDGFAERGGDRKSTRLNSSHGSISYAVFC